MLYFLPVTHSLCVCGQEQRLEKSSSSTTHLFSICECVNWETSVCFLWNKQDCRFTRRSWFLVSWCQRNQPKTRLVLRLWCHKYTCMLQLFRWYWKNVWFSVNCMKCNRFEFFMFSSNSSFCNQTLFSVVHFHPQPPPQAFPRASTPHPAAPNRRFCRVSSRVPYRRLCQR